MPLLASPKSSPENVSLSTSVLQAAVNLEANLVATTSSTSTSGQQITVVHRHEDLDAAFSLSLLEQTPFKFDPQSIPITPNIVTGNQTLDTPLTRLLNTMDLHSVLKNNPLPTPVMPKTPGTGSGATPGTEVKSIDGYSSASSYYRPDDIIDKQVEQQIAADQLEATAKKLKSATVEKSEPEMPTTPKTDTYYAQEVLQRKEPIGFSLDDLERRAQTAAILEEKKARTIDILKRKSEATRIAKPMRTKFLCKLPTPQKKPQRTMKRRSSGRKVSLFKNL